jgi:lysophospholipase L1-like esterase
MNPKNLTDEDSGSQENRLLWGLVTAVTSVLLLLGALEGFSRLALHVEPRVERFRLSHQLGWEWTPGYQATETYHGVDYQMHISAQGLRNEMVTMPKPEDTYRIIALGDSITEGPGVELEGTFVKILEQSLNEDTPHAQSQNTQDWKPWAASVARRQGIPQSKDSGEAAPARVEVINAGTGDYGTEQEYLWLRERGMAYAPDMVILEVYLNDSRSFTRPAAPVAILHNFFVRRSAFYHYYFNAVRQQRVAHEEAQPDFRFRLGEDWEAEEWRTDPEALTALIQQADQDWGLAWNDSDMEIIKHYLAQIAQLCRENDVALLLVLFPVDAQVYAEVETPLGLDRPQQELLVFAAAQEVPVVDLLPVLRQHRNENLFYDQAHLKPDTHRLVAAALAEALRAHGLAPTY